MGQMGSHLQSASTQRSEGGSGILKIKDVTPKATLERVSTVTDNAGRVRLFGHDTRGNRIRVQDPEGGVVETGYEGAGRPSRMTETLAQGVTRTTRSRYSHAGLPEWVEDELGRVIQEVQEHRFVEPEVSKTFAYGYDDLGQRTSITYPGGLQVTLDRQDPLRRVMGIQDQADPDHPFASFGYHGPSRVSSRLLGNGIEEILDWEEGQDGTKLLAGIRAWTGEFNLLWDEYTYNERNLVSQIKRVQDGSRSDVLGYNKAGELSDARISVLRPEEELERFRARQEYALDELANFKALKSYRRLADIHTTIEPVINEQNQYTEFAGEAVGHDANGSSRGGFTYHWDYKNRLARVNRGEEEDDVTFRYDALGRRISK
jgi:YD repeat-containing protein